LVTDHNVQLDEFLYELAEPTVLRDLRLSLLHRIPWWNHLGNRLALYTTRKGPAWAVSFGGGLGTVTVRFATLAKPPHQGSGPYIPDLREFAFQPLALGFELLE